MAMQPGERRSIGDRQIDLAPLGIAGQAVGDAPLEVLDPSPVSADTATTSSSPDSLSEHGFAGFLVERVDLVPHLQDGNVGALPSPVAPISASTCITSAAAWASVSGWAMSRTWTDQVGRDHFLQRGAEGRDKLGRQVGDEAHRGGQDRLVDAPAGAICRMVDRACAKSRSSAITAAPVMRLNSVDLPALV